MANKNPNPATRFKPGEKPPGNGRPKEARDRLSRAFLTSFADDFEKNGVKVIEDVRREEPGTYLKIGASLLPKEIEITNPMQALSDDKLADAIELLASQIRAKAPAAPPKPDDKPQHTVN